MRRIAPRPLRQALEATVREAAPSGLLPRVQGVWPEVAGPAIAEEAEPVSESAGSVTVGCRSAVWAHELELLGGELRERLNERLGGGSEVRELRFAVRRAAEP